MSDYEKLLLEADYDQRELEVRNEILIIKEKLDLLEHTNFANRLEHLKAKKPFQDPLRVIPGRLKQIDDERIANGIDDSSKFTYGTANVDPLWNQLQETNNKKRSAPSDSSPEVKRSNVVFENKEEEESLIVAGEPDGTLFFSRAPLKKGNDGLLKIYKSEVTAVPMTPIHSALLHGDYSVAEKMLTFYVTQNPKLIQFGRINIDVYNKILDLFKRNLLFPSDTVEDLYDRCSLCAITSTIDKILFQKGAQKPWAHIGKCCAVKFKLVCDAYMFMYWIMLQPTTTIEKNPSLFDKASSRLQAILSDAEAEIKAQAISSSILNN